VIEWQKRKKPKPSSSRNTNNRNHARNAGYAWVSILIDTLAAGAVTLNSGSKRTRKPKLDHQGKHVEPEKKPIRLLFYSILAALVLFLLIIVGFLYQESIIDAPAMTALSTIALSLIFSFIVFSYMLAKGKKLKQIVSELGLSRKRLTSRYIAFGIGLFLLFLAIEFGLGIFSEITNIPIPTNVASELANLPFYFYLFIFIVGPINEEILFRGFLVPRVGIIGSSLVFGLLHYISYFSIAELIAAFAFGIAAGYVFKKTNSLYPSIIGHVLFNFVTVATLFFL
jgi:membrane protease YdiL (CAAX protease family)